MTKPKFLNVADDAGGKRRIATLRSDARSRGRAGLFWLPGFKSDMTSNKAAFLADWAQQNDLACTRFDYFGHGQSEGEFADGTIGTWLGDAAAVLASLEDEPQILVGSSMGGWIALLLAQALGARCGEPSTAIQGMVLIAPAWNMTEDLMWQRFSPEIRSEIQTNGVWLCPSAYDDGPYPITRLLIEDGRRHCFSPSDLNLNIPIRIIHGMGDADVPWQRSLRLVEEIGSDDVRLILVKDGEHRLSRPGDLAILADTIADLVERQEITDGKS